MLDDEGIKVGLIRPITLWPYPDKAFQNLPKTIKRLLCAELNSGQMYDDNSSLIHDEIKSKNKLYGIPINDLSKELGNSRVGNIIILGAYLAINGSFNDNIIQEALIEYLGKDKESYIDINIQAIAREKNI